MITPDPIGYYHPKNEQDIIDLINEANTKKFQIRVRGAGQSVNGAVYTDNFSPTNSPPNSPNCINIMLDQMRAVTPLANSQVKVQAGCNIGYDPFDPADISTPDNSLFGIIDPLGLSIQDVANELHQTVGGFISTGSSGGTVSHSFLNSILSISIIDGTGTKQVFNKPSPDNVNDPFYAMATSMGLLGIITEVTFQCVPKFQVLGTQNIDPDTDAPVDFFGTNNGKPTVQQFFTSTEYARFVWFPYYTLNRLITWQARKMQPSDYNSKTGTPTNFLPNPYQDSFPKVMGSEVPSKLLANGLYSTIGNWPQVLYDFLGSIELSGPDKDEKLIVDTMNIIGPYMLPMFFDKFFPLDKTNPPQEFWDQWWGGIDVDTKEYDDNLFPSIRTELWFPISQSAQVMKIFTDYFSRNSADNFWKDDNQLNRNKENGCYPIEIHGAVGTNFWMSPGFQQDSLRITLYWFANNAGNVSDYFQQFWDLFKQHNISYRLHWGCTLPPATSPETPAYITSQFNKFGDFKSLRNKMDPNNIFLSTYWKTQLAL